MAKLGKVLSFALLLFALAIFITLFLAKEDGDFSLFSPRILSLLQFTLYQAFLSTLLSIMIGVLLAWSLAHKGSFFGRELLIGLFSSSLVLPTLVVVFGLITIYGRHGWINNIIGESSYLYGLFGILLAHVYLNASYASRSLLYAFESIPIEKYKLAKSLGFSTLKRFWIVEYPALKSTMVGVASTIFLLCFTSFAVVLILGGSPSYNTLEVAIYEAVRLEFDIDMALKLALLQLSISTLFVIFSSSLQTSVNNLSKIQLRSWREPIMITMMQWSIIVIFALFFISPLVAIMIDGIGADFQRIVYDRVFLRSLSTSLILATLSAFLTLLFAVALSDAKRGVKSRSGSIMIGFASHLYLAIPSLVLGLGFFLLSQRFPLEQSVWATIALITANVLMALPFAISIIAPIMHKTASRYDRLSRSLGVVGYQRWVTVELPYLRASLAYVFALAFCFSLGDLGIIALFGSNDFMTLPWYLYGLMGSYRTSDAAGVALIMLILVLGVFLVIPRIFKEKSA